ncbi:DnaJ-class molecular chaperone with C-terminal Zn finger domain [Caulobacter sp. AP07]|uniref:DnaJ C-terminal domain-containing protein n=1 Tax=Caulobacter sp. AP07 TaxID=1144304 RepID=UPI000271F7B6|nr:DnaJ C-terminal domain-containing protein [Caulobacter sp. AP07]EJL30555.1 DnaJ-class molecular chaperone with C-terminal Zn finger domain [Caulobacter sp. AP07]
MARDPYLELGVSRTATAAEIRKAFHKLAKQHHPDANTGDKKSEDRFKQVSAAFDIIGDPDKRKKFDAGEIDADGRETMRGGGFGGAGSPFGGGFNRGGGGFGRGGGAGDGPEIDLNDLFGDILGRNRGAGGGFSSPRGGDVRARLDIDLEEAITGGKKRVAFSDGRTIDVTIPVGAQEGQTLRLKGQGSPGRGGAGDALIELAIKPHRIYHRENDTLVMDLPISVPDAVLGGKVEAPTPDGPVTLSIPKGSNSGAKLRLKGRGLSDGKGKRGDLFARLVVTLPDTPDAELEKFAEAWREKRPYTPRRR